MRAVQSKTLGERLFGKKSKASCKNKVKNTVLTLPSKRKLNPYLGVGEQPYKKSKIEVEKQRAPMDSGPSKMSMDEKKELKKELIEILVSRTAEKLRSEFRKLGLEIPRKEVIDLEFDKFGEDVFLLLKRVVKDNKANVVASLPETTQPAQSAPVTDLKTALIAARAAMKKKAIPGKVQQDAKGQIKCCKRNVDEYDQLLELCGCRLSYDSCIGVVLRLREVKTMKIVDPLASIGLKLKKQFVADPTDYDDYSADVDLEEVEARRIEQRKGRDALETSVDKDNKMLAYDQLLVLCGCSLSYDSHILRLREFKTGKLLDPLARIGLKLKRQFVADYDDCYAYVDLEEGEKLDSDSCDMELEEGEILE